MSSITVSDVIGAKVSDDFFNFKIVAKSFYMAFNSPSKAPEAFTLGVISANLFMVFAICKKVFAILYIIAGLIYLFYAFFLLIDTHTLFKLLVVL